MNIEKRKSGLVRITKMVHGVRYRVSVHFEPTREEAELLIENEILKNHGRKPASKRRLVDIQKWQKKKDVFVYFAKNEMTGFTKIGVSCNVLQRMSALITACGAPITVIDTIQCGSYREAFDTEKYFHDLFDKFRLNFGRKTEWFNLNAAEISIPIAVSNYYTKKEKVS